MLVNSLIKVVSGQTILNGVTLCVAPGTTTGLRGPSGGGKSTLLRCVAGLDDFTHGAIVEHDTPLDAIARLARCSLVTQDYRLWPHLTVAESFCLVRRTSARAAETQFVETVLKRLQIDHLLNKYPGSISGGERQRVRIALALAVRSRYLLLDEPSSALDDARAAALVELLADVQRLGVGVLIASHDRWLLSELCSTIYRIEDGTAVPDSSLENAASNARMSQNVAAR